MQRALIPEHEMLDPAGMFSTIGSTIGGLFRSHTAMLETSKTGGLADASFDELFALQERSFAEARPGDTSEERANNLLISLEKSILAPSGALAPEPVNITFADLKDLQALHPNQFSMLSTLAATKNNDPLISNHVFTPDEPIYAAAMNSGTAIGAFKPGVSSVKSDKGIQEEVLDGATVAELPVFIDPDTSQDALDLVNQQKPAFANSDAHKREAMQKMYEDHISDGMDPEQHQNSEFFVFREQGNAMDQAMGVLDETVLSRARQAEGADTTPDVDAQIAREDNEIAGIQEPIFDFQTRAAFAVSGALPQSSAFGTSITAEMYRSNSTKTAQMLASCISKSADPVAQRQRIMDFNTTGAVQGLVDPEAIGRLSEIGRQRAEHPPTPAEEVSVGLDSFIMEDYFDTETTSDETEAPQAGLDATRERPPSPVFRDPDIDADLEDSLQAAGSCIVDQSTTSQKDDAVQKTPSLGKADQDPKSSKNAPPASSTTPTPSV